MTIDEYFAAKGKLYQFEQRVMIVWGKLRGKDLSRVVSFHMKEDPLAPTTNCVVVGVQYCNGKFETDFVDRSELMTQLLAMGEYNYRL